MLVGDIRVDPVLDGTITYDAARILRRPGVDDPWRAHADLLNARGELDVAVGGFLVRTGQRVVLVDAGLGRITGDGHHGGALLDNLTALGVDVEDVTDVVLTHLHYDHVGWTAQKGAVVFPRATYRCHEADWEHFVSGRDPLPGAVKKLSPVADRLELFGDGATLAPGLDARLAAGHTPGSTLIVASSGTARAMLLGDVVHCPFELTEADWEAVFDVDPQLAKRTRETLARELEGTDIPVAAAHFPGLRFGRLLAGEGSRSWVFD